MVEIAKILVMEDEIISIINEFPQIDVDEIKRRYEVTFSKSVNNYVIIMTLEKLKAKNIITESNLGVLKMYSPISQNKKHSHNPFKYFKIAIRNKEKWKEYKDILAILATLMTIFVALINL